MQILLELNSENLSEAIKISPIASFKGSDGRKYNLNEPEQIIKKLKAKNRDLLLDKNHEDGEAMGWFLASSLQAKSDGIYANLELTKKGRELVENKAFRYLSPVYIIDEESRIIDILSIGLVNRPNLPQLKSLNKEKGEEMEKLEELKANIELLKSENEALKKELEDAKALQNEALLKNKEQMLDNLISSKQLLPAHKECAMKMNNDESLQAYLAVCKEVASSLYAQKSVKPSPNTDKINEEIAKKIGLKKGE